MLENLLKYLIYIFSPCRMAEHACLTARADEERKNNPNYKPILEHDGLLWQRSRNQVLLISMTNSQISKVDIKILFSIVVITQPNEDHEMFSDIF